MDSGTLNPSNLYDLSDYICECIFMMKGEGFALSYPTRYCKPAFHLHYVEKFFEKPFVLESYFPEVMSTRDLPLLWDEKVPSTKTRKRRVLEIDANTSKRMYYDIFEFANNCPSSIIDKINNMPVVDQLYKDCISLGRLPTLTNKGVFFLPQIGLTSSLDNPLGKRFADYGYNEINDLEELIGLVIVLLKRLSHIYLEKGYTLSIQYCFWNNNQAFTIRGEKIKTEEKVLLDW